MLAEKPLISEETDLIEPSLLDELICHISSLASVYHRPPSSFVAGKSSQKRAQLPSRGESGPEPSASAGSAPAVGGVMGQPTLSQVAGGGQQPVAPQQPTTDSLLGDLLELGPSSAPAPMSTGGGGFDAPYQPQASNSCMTLIFVISLTFLSHDSCFQYWVRMCFSW